MAIETYLIEEAGDLISNPEKTDEWHKIVDELGLEGQKPQAKEGCSPIPFQKLKSGEKRTYEILCPNKINVKQYSNSTIPLRVLSLIALCEKEKYFDKVMIWDDLASPDPVVIGIKGNEWSDDNHYIIARWGDELRSYVELKKIALEKLVINAKNKIERELKTVEENVKMYLNGEYISHTEFFR